MLRCLMLNVKVKNEAECMPERDPYDECKNKKKKTRGCRRGRRRASAMKATEGRSLVGHAAGAFN